MEVNRPSPQNLSGKLGRKNVPVEKRHIRTKQIAEKEERNGPMALQVGRMQHSVQNENRAGTARTSARKEDSETQL